MDQVAIEAALQELPLSAIRFFDKATSTNDLAAEWFDQGAADLSLVIADEQTAGRGRAGRRWYTPPGAALAFSVILHPTSPDWEGQHPRLAGLGALSVCIALRTNYHLEAEIKWPNDVLVRGHKVAGILAETHWLGEQLRGVILGIGVNTAPAAIPPTEKVDFPATSVESALGREVDRLLLLRDILRELIDLRQDLTSAWFLDRWLDHIAFKDRWVRALSPTGEPIEGRVVGLTHHGYLKLRTRSGQVTRLHAGDVQLRPVNQGS